MKIYILRLNRDQLRKMQFQGLQLGIEPESAIIATRKQTSKFPFPNRKRTTLPLKIFAAESPRLYYIILKEKKSISLASFYEALYAQRHTMSDSFITDFGCVGNLFVSNVLPTFICRVRQCQKLPRTGYQGRRGRLLGRWSFSKTRVLRNYQCPTLISRE